MPANKKNKKQTASERFMLLSDAEKDAVVAKCDKPLPVGHDGLAGKPLRKRDLRLHDLAAARGAGRPQVGPAAKIVPVSIERGLLKEADAFARRHRLKRSQMVAAGFRLVIQRRAGGPAGSRAPICRNS